MTRNGLPSLSRDRLSMGIRGLDDVMGGGLPAGRMYLVDGDPGTGKTTMALQFLIEGHRAGERVLYVTLSESRIELAAAAGSHGWSIDGLTVREYLPKGEVTSVAGQVTMFHPAEVELLDTVRRMLTDVEELNPSRVVVDSLSEIRL